MLSVCHLSTVMQVRTVIRCLSDYWIFRQIRISPGTQLQCVQECKLQVGKVKTWYFEQPSRSPGGKSTFLMMTFTSLCWQRPISGKREQSTYILELFTLVNELFTLVNMLKLSLGFLRNQILHSHTLSVYTHKHLAAALASCLDSIFSPFTCYQLSARTQTNSTAKKRLHRGLKIIVM